MPVKPNSSESKDDFMGRCVPIEINNGHPQDQAVAICYSKWDESHKTNLSKVKRVIFSEDFDDESVRKWKTDGYKVHILSKRKIHRKDKKTWNKLKNVGLTEDNLVFGDIKELDSKYDYESIQTGKDPVLDALLLRGRDISKMRVLKSKEVSNVEEALSSQDMIKDVELRFVKVNVLYTYELRDDLSGPAIIDTTRDFCETMINSNMAWTLEEIKSISGTHLTKMGLPDDVFKYRGGFYHNPDTDKTTPFCRHTFKAKVVIE